MWPEQEQAQGGVALFFGAAPPVVSAAAFARRLAWWRAL